MTEPTDEEIDELLETLRLTEPHFSDRVRRAVVRDWFWKVYKKRIVLPTGVK